MGSLQELPALHALVAWDSYTFPIPIITVTFAILYRLSFYGGPEWQGRLYTFVKWMDAYFYAFVNQFLYTFHQTSHCSHGRLDHLPREYRINQGVETDGDHGHPVLLTWFTDGSGSELQMPGQFLSEEDLSDQGIEDDAAESTESRTLAQGGGASSSLEVFDRDGLDYTDQKQAESSDEGRNDYRPKDELLSNDDREKYDPKDKELSSDNRDSYSFKAKLSGDIGRDSNPKDEVLSSHGGHGHKSEDEVSSSEGRKGYNWTDQQLSSEEGKDHSPKNESPSEGLKDHGPKDKPSSEGRMGYNSNVELLSGEDGHGHISSEQVEPDEGPPRASNKREASANLQSILKRIWTQPGSMTTPTPVKDKVDESVMADRQEQARIDTSSANPAPLKRNARVSSDPVKIRPQTPAQGVTGKKQAQARKLQIDAVGAPERVSSSSKRSVFGMPRSLRHNKSKYGNALKRTLR